ncbi:YigZ family protein [Corynebacterium sp. zg254]|uniref:YigZ family protein n=1 Tax=Corynebacterium sp. zg254 TaxID=2656645 RepID=UPI002150E714|nr:YigZ family protein [Corynebacterium sp. zg254]MCR5914415.1 YigZ family protein [Corynebacterium sp. zg254]
MESYRRPGPEEYSAELEIKRSQFLGFIRRTETEDEARQFIQDIRARYPDARHHCSAFIIHQDDAQPIERSSDDGEPAGTAGQPMLDVLRGYMDITAVVVRYFGGVLLGTGGLVRAYHDATKAALDTATITTRRSVHERFIDVDHAQAGKLEAEIRNAGHTITNVDYAEHVTMTVATTAPEALEAVVAQATGGTVDVRGDATVWID